MSNIDKIKEQFSAIAKEYDARRKWLIPCLDDFYKTPVSLLKFYKSDIKSVVDLGAGTGLLAKEVYEAYNDAHYTLIDISGDMLDVARRRFDGLSNFEFIEENYVNDISVKNCDVICSALSIHHLTADDKAKLYENIHETLEAGGCFMNLDQFSGTTKPMEDLYNDWWYDYISRNIRDATTPEKAKCLERRGLDKENTINETVELLKSCGFREAECIYSFMKFGAILAIK
jgi:tRNA (cmo5U34)-methyltransferase